MSSRLSTLDTLGSYRFSVRGGAGAGDTATLNLEHAGGRAAAARAAAVGRDRACASAAKRSAAEGNEAALNNLLNIIGRRQGAPSVISIG